jgi:hypothetical protein
MVTHRSATPGRVGSNLGYGLDATFSFYQNVRFDTYVAGTQTEGRRGDDLSYRGLFDYTGDRYGFTAERLVVEPNFLPEIGFLRRTGLRSDESGANDVVTCDPEARGLPLTFSGHRV